MLAIDYATESISFFYDAWQDDVFKLPNFEPDEAERVIYVTVEEVPNKERPTNTRDSEYVSMCAKCENLFTETSPGKAEGETFQIFKTSMIQTLKF